MHAYVHKHTTCVCVCVCVCVCAWVHHHTSEHVTKFACVRARVFLLIDKRAEVTKMVRNIDGDRRKAGQNEYNQYRSEVSIRLKTHRSIRPSLLYF